LFSKGGWRSPRSQKKWEGEKRKKMFSMTKQRGEGATLKVLGKKQHVMRSLGGKEGKTNLAGRAIAKKKGRPLSLLCRGKRRSQEGEKKKKGRPNHQFPSKKEKGQTSQERKKKKYPLS